MQKKDTTAKAAPARPADDTAALRLARHISAVLTDPATPPNIYTALADAVCELYAPQGYYNSVEYIAAHLAVNLRNGGTSDA